MKIGKVLGVTFIVSAASCMVAWVYNEARWEKMNREFLQERMRKPVADSVKQSVKRTAKIIK